MNNFELKKLKKAAKKAAKKLGVPYVENVTTKEECDKIVSKLKLYRMFTTTNYDLIIDLDCNRGADNGKESKRVNELVKQIDSGTYAFRSTFVLVNMKFKTINGRHTKEAFKLRGLPVPFIVTDDPMFNNVSDREFANNVSLINNVDSTWRDKGNFDSAFKAGERCAVNINKLIVLIPTKNLLRKSAITPARVIGIMDNFDKLKASKKLRDVYCSDYYADMAVDSKFNVKFTNIVRFMEKLYVNPKLRGYEIASILGSELNNIAKNVGLDPYNDWSKVLPALERYIAKNDISQMGDRKDDMKTIALGVLNLMNRK
jgi:hypothetical protein